MGLLQSRSSTQAQDTDLSTLNAYHYPPKAGNYFGGHFIMGGERFESSKLDAYLFGENDDLNFLGGKPVLFPYASTQPNEPTRTLRSLVNIRRDSLKLIKECESMNGESSSRYNIEFVFDADVRCAITIFYHATDEMHAKQAIYKPRDASMNSETFHYKRGANQLFSQPTHFIDPTALQQVQWQYNFEKEIIPIVIHCVVEEEEHVGHSHATFAVIDALVDGSLNLRALKQKQVIDGLPYLLQEIYGIENKNTLNSKGAEDEVEDNGSECVICMSELRDTIILPCRHLCLCNSCAEHLRYQANNCPICRSKFKALLQIRAISKNSSSNPRHMGGSEDGIPGGYVAVSLIEALNGPTLPHRACHPTPTFTSDATLQSLLNAAPPIINATSTTTTQQRLSVTEPCGGGVEDEDRSVAAGNGLGVEEEALTSYNAVTAAHHCHPLSISTTSLHALPQQLHQLASASSVDAVSPSAKHQLESSSSLHTIPQQQQQEQEVASSSSVDAVSQQRQQLFSSSSGTYNSSTEQFPDEQSNGRINERLVDQPTIEYPLEMEQEHAMHCVPTPHVDEEKAESQTNGAESQMVGGTSEGETEDEMVDALS